MSGVLDVRPGGLRPWPAVRSAVRAAARPATGRRRRPEWWLYAVAAAGWVVLVVAAVGTLLDQARVSARPDPPGMASGHDHLHHQPLGSGVATSDASWWDSMSGGTWVHHGPLMLAMVAVMLPLVAPNVRYAALRSPRSARRGVVVAVVSGWASVWLVAGLVVGVVGAVLASVGGYAAMAAVTVAAAGWQWSWTKRRSVARCHRVIAPPLAPAAARSAGRAFGRGLGRDCASSCLPMMLVMAVFAHALLVTVAVAGVAWYERRRRPHHDPAPRATAAVVVAAGGLAMLMTLVVPRALVAG